MSDIKHHDVPLFLDTEPAMKRAAEQARRIAIQTGTPLAIWRDGRVVLIQPDELVVPITTPTTPTTPTTSTFK